MDRGGTELVPARLGRVFPIRELRPHIRCDQPVRPGTAGRVRGQAPQTQPPLGHAAGDLRVTGQLRADHLVRNRHRPQALPALAGTGRTPTVKNVGEPCAGEPHARFDGEGLETEPRPPRQSLTLPRINRARGGCLRKRVVVWVLPDYAYPRWWETPSRSKAWRWTGVGVVMRVKAGR